MPIRGKDAFKARLRDKSDKLVRGVALEAHGRIMRRTPVDKGRARNNWNVSIGSIDRSYDESLRGRGGQHALQEGQRVILGRFRPGDVLYITNSLPYVPELERGHSKQAPQGMVAVTAAEMGPLVSRVLASIATGA